MMMRAALLLLLLTSGAQAQELTGTLAKIRDAGRIGLGIRDRSLPFGYLDGDRPVGYGIDVCLRVVAAIEQALHLPKLTVDMRPVQSATRFSLLKDGTIDMDCGTTSNTVERQREFAFSNTYFVTTMRYVSRRLAGLAGIEGLRGRTVAVTANTSNLAELRRLDTEHGLALPIKVLPTTGEAFRVFEAGEADAFVADDVLIGALVAATPAPALYTIDATPLSEPEPYAIMLRQGDAPFKAAVDQATGALFRSDEGSAVYRHWFQSVLPGRGINLAMPMSPSLRRAFERPTDSPDPARYSN